jgi:hypothetical protein
MLPFLDQIAPIPFPNDHDDRPDDVWLDENPGRASRVRAVRADDPWARHFPDGGTAIVRRDHDYVLVVKQSLDEYRESFEYQQDHYTGLTPDIRKLQAEMAWHIDCLVDCHAEINWEHHHDDDFFVNRTTGMVVKKAENVPVRQQALLSARAATATLRKSLAEAEAELNRLEAEAAQ